MTRFLVLPLISTILAAIPAEAADPACQPVMDAQNKMLVTPVHIYSSETADYLHGKVRSSEMIYLNDSSYLQVNGKWRPGPMNAQEVRKMAQSSTDAKATCRLIRDEAVNGEAAVLYSTHVQLTDAKMDGQIWISKARGLPVKQESDMDVGGAAGKSHRTLRYEYTNVRPPAGVQ